MDGSENTVQSKLLDDLDTPGEPTPPTDAAHGLYDTYLVALQNDAADLPTDTWRVGVVNIEMYGFGNEVDENFEVLGPPDDLFNEFRETRSALTDDGMDGAEAHNTAWDEVNFTDRYMAFLTEEWETGTAVRDRCDAILEKLESRPVAVVCYEGSEKRCHRSVLKDFLHQRLTETS